MQGLWTGSLPKDLLWIPFGTQENSTLYSIPSWSWAARLGPIEFLLDSPDQLLSETESLCRVVEVTEQQLQIESYIQPIPDLF